MAERRHGHRAAPTESTVSGTSREGEERSRQTHTRVAFVDLDLTEATFDGMVFEECTFKRARFN